ncbi:MAG: hypothetical protein A2136_09070 [Chloroflexi bacterium RBG_16_54_11]|nr:MAG: hypothetical protein A2136_09070 [Chloroflexi bacterium RBG_16_54_11]
MSKKGKMVINSQGSSEVDAEWSPAENTQWTTQVLVIGAVVGALTGLGGAYLLIQRARRRSEPPRLDAREGLRLGLLLMGLLRQVAMLGDDEK